MERIKEHIGENFAITGTKKQLLEVEKELKKLGYKNVRDKNDYNKQKRLNELYLYIVTYNDMEYSYHTHQGCDSKFIIEL